MEANVTGDGNIVVQADHGGTVTIGSPQRNLTLTLYAERTKRLAQSGAETAWLSAYRSDVVQLLGRTREMADLRGWLASEPPVSLRALVGGAGRGKTRLAMELSRSLHPEWDAGFVGASDFDNFWAARRTEKWRWEKPTLVVFDYAASRGKALKDWLDELVDAPVVRRPKLRLLLLERQAQTKLGWLAELVGRDGDAAGARASLFDPREPVELGPLEDLTFRRELFAALLRRADARLDAPEIGVDAEFDRKLGEHKWSGDPLFLMMAGLVAARAGVSAALSLSHADLALEIADWELHRIGASHGVAPAFLRRMAALATLVQGASLSDARALAAAERAALDASADLDAVVMALREALPGREIGAILPDIVGEAALLRVFGADGEGVAGGVAVAPRLIAAARTAVKAASETLVRAAQDFAAAGRLEPIRWLEAWSEAPETDLGALMQIADTLPDQTLALRETAVGLHAKIYNMIVDLRKTSSAANLEPVLAATANNLSVRLSEIGRREEALAAAQEAVDLYRSLAAERPDAFRPDLAGSLNNLGNRLSELGRREEALTAVQEAVDIYRSLAAERPDAFRPVLAMSLNNLGARLSELGRREEALTAVQEAVDIYRSLAAERPDAFRPDLAMSFNNLGNRLSALGRREEALAAVQEAVDIYRSLAAERPDAFRPDLAMSLNNLGARLSALGRREEALAAAQEAADLYRSLAAERPDAFRPDLAMSFNNLGNAYSELGRREEALAAAQEAVSIRRSLAAERPDAFRPDLAGSLNNLGARLSELGRREEALTAVQEAVDIYRSLAAERPDAFRPDLAGSLGVLGNVWEASGRVEDACVAIREAIETLGPYFLRRPLAHAGWMAAMCEQYVARCEALRQAPDEALLAPIIAALAAPPNPASPPST